MNVHGCIQSMFFQELATGLGTTLLTSEADVTTYWDCRGRLAEHCIR